MVVAVFFLLTAYVNVASRIPTSSETAEELLRLIFGQMFCYDVQLRFDALGIRQLHQLIPLFFRVERPSLCLSLCIKGETANDSVIRIQNSDMFDKYCMFRRRHD